MKNTDVVIKILSNNHHYVYGFLYTMTLYFFKDEIKKMIKNIYSCYYYKNYIEIIIKKENIKVSNCIEKYLVDNEICCQSLIVRYDEKNEKLVYKPCDGIYKNEDIEYILNDNEIILMTNKKNSIRLLKNKINDIINKYYEEFINMEEIHNADISYIIPRYNLDSEFV